MSKSILIWLLIAVAVWEGWVYIYSKTDQARARKWEEFNHAFRARPHTGDTITDVEAFLRRERSQ